MRVIGRSMRRMADRPTSMSSRSGRSVEASVTPVTARAARPWAHNAGGTRIRTNSAATAVDAREDLLMIALLSDNYLDPFIATDDFHARGPRRHDRRGLRLYDGAGRAAHADRHRLRR